MRNLARLALALLFLGAPLAGCTTNATTGRSQIAMMSRDEEVQMGQQLGPEFSQQSGGEVPDPQLRAYVTEVGTKLSAGVVDQDKSLPWKFTLLNSDVINAFALPGGQVFFSLGLGRLMTNEAQMAGVIGHEIGHVTARHINERMGDQLKANILASIVGVGLGDTAGGLAQQAAEIGLLKYSRGQESEADYLGMKYMAAQGYDPAAQGQVMQILVEASKGSSQPEFLSTHPDPARRVKEVADRLKTEEFAHTQNNPQYQLYPERFKQRFLDRLAALPKPPPPPPPPPAPQGLAPSSSGTLAAGVMGPPSEDVLASLGPPTMWCAFCRAHAHNAETTRHAAARE
jgi:predicted Zn-dependent protease